MEDIKPEPQPEPAPAPEPDTRTVPLAALREARDQNRELKRRVETMEGEFKTGNERLNTLLKSLQAPAVPDPDQDPVGALTHKVNEAVVGIGDLKKEREDERQVAFAREREAGLEHQWNTAARTFSDKQPDFPQAYDHLFKNVLEEFGEAGYSAEQAQHLTKLYWQDIVARAQQDGVNPAQRMYGLAKRRGFKGQDKIETIAEGQQKAKSLSQAGGAPPSNLTFESLANMDNDEFKRMSDKDWKRLAGG